MSKINKPQLNEFEITQYVFYFGVKTFTNEDLNFWVNKENNYEEFMNKYFLNINNDVEYASNILRVHYDIEEDIDNRIFQVELKGNDSAYGNTIIQNARIPLLDINDEVVGAIVVTETLSFINNDPVLNKNNNGGLYQQTQLTYFLEKNIFFPRFINDEDTLNDDIYQTINILQSTGSRSNLTVFYQPGDIFILKGSSESQVGLDKMNGVVCIYVDSNRRRNIILNFNKVSETYFIPKQNYGVGDI